MRQTIALAAICGLIFIVVIFNLSGINNPYGLLKIANTQINVENIRIYRNDECQLFIEKISTHQLSPWNNNDGNQLLDINCNPE